MGKTVLITGGAGDPAEEEDVVDLEDHGPDSVFHLGGVVSAGAEETPDPVVPGKRHRKGS